MLDQETLSRPREDLRRRIIAFSVYIPMFVAFWLIIGLPTDIIAALGWLWLATVCWRIDRPWRSHLRFLRDWLPLVLLLSAYDLSRGFADDGAQPHVREMVEFDTWVMGGHDLPTTWLQRTFFDPTTIHWWDLLASLIYYSHFVATPVAAVVLWVRNRDLWQRFTRRWIMLSIAGLTTYFLYPAAPPWWAAREGMIGEVTRVAIRNWRLLGFRTAGHVTNVTDNLSNPVAAMPSLHAAFSLFVVAFFLPRTRRRWWPVLLAYPATMAVVLVYSGEHWIIDILVGFSYVGLVYVVARGVEQGLVWWRTPRPAEGRL